MGIPNEPEKVRCTLARDVAYELRKVAAVLVDRAMGDVSETKEDELLAEARVLRRLAGIIMRLNVAR